MLVSFLMEKIIGEIYERKVTENESAGASGLRV